MKQKELIILERGNGWYGGYEKCKEGYMQVFNTQPGFLFTSMKNFTDKGYSVKCLDASQEQAFMEGRNVLA